MNTTELSHTIGLQSIPIDKYKTLLGGDKLRKKKDILFNNFGIIAFGLSKKLIFYFFRLIFCQFGVIVSAIGPSPVK